MSRVIGRRLVVALGKQGGILVLRVGGRILPSGRRFTLIVSAVELSLGPNIGHCCGRYVGLLIYLRTFLVTTFVVVAHSISKIMAVSKQRAA